MWRTGGAGRFDAALLDVMLPEMDGFELCRVLRREPPPLGTLPLVMLTARGDVMDRVVGLELGADDYLPKPFEPRELLARLQTVWRRSAPAPATTPEAPAPLRFERLLIDPARRNVQLDGRTLELTGTEYELLLMLAAVPGRVFSRDDILTRLRGHAAEDIQSRAVDLLVSRKIGAVFVESSVSDRSIRALIEGAAAQGHTVTIGGELFSDAMGEPGSYEGTYIGMMDHNVTTIVRALGGRAPERGFQNRLGTRA